MLTFTGSSEVGWELKGRAGRKKVALELGGNAGVLLLPDADLDLAARRCADAGFGYAGQSCISVQRILVHQDVHDAFQDKLLRHVDELKVGDPLDESVTVGPLIREEDAIRVESWIEEACRGGARLLTGGKRHKSLLTPAVLADVQPAMKVSCREVFAPVVSLSRVAGVREGIDRLNDPEYGLQAGIFTRDLEAVETAYRDVEVGGLLVNEVPTFRLDAMPYGGVKGSGTGREGPRYAVEEMTEPRLLVRRPLGTFDLG
jgi:glyceraldehyde-3-phosphate dehydrogenase (NADP+)